MARRTLAQLARLVVYVLVFFFWGCSSQGNGKSFLSGLLHRIHANRAPAQLSPWSWLPSSNAKAAELATIPPGAQLELSIPEKNPISTHSEAPGGIDSSLNFVPTVKKSLVVDGGALISRLGPVTKTAQWGDWDEAWSDPTHKTRFGWGYCITAGEVILPRAAFEHIPSDRYAENTFAIEPYGDQYVLIRVDPTKGQRVCWVGPPYGGGTTAGWIGSKAEVNGEVFERRPDGWYLGQTRMSN